MAKNLSNRRVDMWNERERRIRLVMKWIRAAEKAGGVDRRALITRARSEWPGLDRDSKAEAVISDAERVLAGSASLESLRGGRHREFIRKVSVSDLEEIARLADEVTAGSDMRALFSAIQNMREKYLA